MSKSEKDKDLEIISEIAKEIAEATDSTKEKNSLSKDKSDNSPVGNSNAAGLTSSQDNHNTEHNKKSKKADKVKPALTLKELAAKKQYKNLAERKILLVILATLLGIQLLFMNTVVLLIVLWSFLIGMFFENLTPMF